MIKDIAFVAYPVADVAKTREWYEKYLGLSFSGPYEENGIEMYNEANVGNGCFSLMHHGWGDKPAGSAHGCAFEVDDLDATVARLRAAGLNVADPYQTPVCKMTNVKDPEGGTVTLHQRTAPPRA